jgi:hypothetical protein
MTVRGAVAHATTGAKSRSHTRIGFGSFRFYVALILVAVALHFIGTIVSYIPIIEADPPQELATEYRKKQIDIWAEMNKLLIALATVSIGAIGGFLLKGDAAAPLPPRQARRAAAGWIFCALSLYFGYLSYHEATLMLSLGTFNSNSPRLWWPTRAQFWTFILSVILFADLVYGATHTRRQREPER